MIESVYIKDFILFDELKVEFGRGLNVFTGETGAGKSIIISAIDTALGAKAGKDLIKSGRRKAFIEASFRISGSSLDSMLEEHGIDMFDGELIFSREITSSSSRCRINGTLVPLDTVRTIRAALVDIHSQHQTYSYMSPSCHLSLLDGFGDDSHRKLIDEYRIQYAEYRAVSKKIALITSRMADSERRRDFLAYQIGEIESARIESQNEDSEIEDELKILLNAEKLGDLALESYNALENDESGALAAIGRASSALSKILSLDSSVSQAAEMLDSAAEAARDAAILMRRYCENIEKNPHRIKALQDRAEILSDLKRKYGRTLSDVIASLESFREELESIDAAEVDLESLRKKLSDTEKKMALCASSLSESRKALAVSVSSLITEKLRLLELPKAEFFVSLDDCGFYSEGREKAEFLVSVNVSEPLRPMAKTASGGEISRIMLALKAVFADSDIIDTVIFDEIDTGISGKASASVARELLSLSEKHQVLAVTHQGVIAAKSSKYFFVEKVQGDETSVTVRELEGEEKLKALAAMVFGKVNEDSVNSARFLL